MNALLLLAKKHTSYLYRQKSLLRFVSIRSLTGDRNPNFSYQLFSKNYTKYLFIISISSYYLYHFYGTFYQIIYCGFVRYMLAQIIINFSEKFRLRHYDKCTIPIKRFIFGKKIQAKTLVSAVSACVKLIT